MDGGVRLHIYLSRDLHTKLKAWCVQNGRTMQSAATEIISRTVEGKLPVAKAPPAAPAVRSTPDQRWDPTIVHRTPEDLRSAALVGMPALNRKRRDAGLEPLSAEEYLAMD